jgi:hypothetical protein
MRKDEIINNLKTNHYSFKDDSSQIIVKLARKYYLTLNLNNENIINYIDSVKSSILFRKNIPLKSELYNVIISTIILILLLFLWNHYIEGTSIFILNIFFVTILGYFIEIIVQVIYYYSRLAKIKKLLNLS